MITETHQLIRHYMQDIHISYPFLYFTMVLIMAFETVFLFKIKTLKDTFKFCILLLIISIFFYCQFPLIKDNSLLLILKEYLSKESAQFRKNVSDFYALYIFLHFASTCGTVLYIKSYKKDLWLKIDNNLYTIFLILIIFIIPIWFLPTVAYILNQ